MISRTLSRDQTVKTTDVILLYQLHFQQILLKNKTYFTKATQ